MYGIDEQSDHQRTYKEQSLKKHSQTNKGPATEVRTGLDSVWWALLLKSIQELIASVDQWGAWQKLSYGLTWGIALPRTQGKQQWTQNLLELFKQTQSTYENDPSIEGRLQRGQAPQEQGCRQLRAEISPNLGIMQEFLTCISSMEFYFVKKWPHEAIKLAISCLLHYLNI